MTTTLPAPLQPPDRTIRRGPGWWIVILGAAVIAALTVALIVGLTPGDDDAGPPPLTTSTTVAPSTSTTGTVPPGQPGAAGTALWPFPGSSTRFTSPTDAARSFAVDFLRFRAPVVEAFQAGDTRSGEVPVRPSPRGPVTTIVVRQLGSDDTWSVLSAMTANIEITSPNLGGELSSPVRVTGRALAYEGTVQVEVRADGETGPIGAGFVTGGGDELRPFDGTIPFETPGAPAGALVLFTESAENGEVWEATALRVRLRSVHVDAEAASED